MDAANAEEDLARQQVWFDEVETKINDLNTELAGLKDDND